MLNKVTLMGNVGRTPHISLTQEGKEFAKFSLATTLTWKDKEGEWQSATDWHQVAVFRAPTARWIKDVLKRGDKIYVEGRLVYQLWRDRYGQPRKTTYVVISDQSGKVEHIRSSQSNAQNNPVKNEIEQDMAPSNVAPAPEKDENADVGEYACSPLEVSDTDSLSDQFPQDKGEVPHEH